MSFDGGEEVCRCGRGSGEGGEDGGEVGHDITGGSGDELAGVWTEDRRGRWGGDLWNTCSVERYLAWRDIASAGVEWRSGGVEVEAERYRRVWKTR